MAGLSLDGLSSGLPTSDMINQLMQVEAIPQSLLKVKQSTTSSFVTALQALNTKVASLAEAAGKVALPASWSAFSATSSATTVTATASASAQAATLSFSVDAVASTQISLSAQFANLSEVLPTQPPVVTIQKSDGTLVTVEPATGDLSAVTKAINDAADSGVKATAVRVSNSEPPQYVLQFTGTATGEDGSFKVFAGTAAEVTAGTATRIDSTDVRTAADAKVTLWKGTAAEKSFEQSSNTFTGLMTGVDVTVSKVTAAGEDPVTIVVGRDDEALTKLASGLVGSLSVVLSEIKTRTASTTTTGTDGRVVVTGGIFSGDSAVRALQQQMSSAVSFPVDGSSPSEAGIIVNRDGTFTFDEEKFATALAADPAKVQRIISGIAERVAEVGENTSDKIDGSLTQKITSQQGLVTNLGDQITDWDRRLESRREGLVRTYAALEVAMSNMASTSSWLTSQIASLPTYS